jgi:hypothetical protein
VYLAENKEVPDRTWIIAPCDRAILIVIITRSPKDRFESSPHEKKGIMGQATTFERCKQVTTIQHHITSWLYF